MITAQASPALEGSPVAVSVTALVKGFHGPRPLGQVLRHPLRRRRVQALDGVTLEVPPGRLVGLIGPNGAGKTTLIKVLAGLVLADAGEALILGHPAGGSESRRLVGLVTADERSFYWRISARENLRFFASLHGLHGRAAQDRIDALSERLGLAEVLEKPFRELSSGNRGRLALARGLIHEPRVLLLDEPARALDPGAAKRLRRLLLDLAATDGIAALYATHDLAEVRRTCDGAVLLDGGKVLASGPFDAVAEVARRTFDLDDEDLA